jgi:hypothetical protein
MVRVGGRIAAAQKFTRSIKWLHAVIDPSSLSRPVRPRNIRVIFVYHLFSRIIGGPARPSKTARGGGSHFMLQDKSRRKF